MHEHDVEDRVLPAGRLREPIDAARSADAILWTGREDAGRVASRLGVAAGFRLRRVAGPLTMAGDRAATPGPGSPVVALAGIARPERFFRELEAEGYDVRARLAFRDHHPYSTADVERIRRAAAGCGAVVLTTEKDLVRLLPLAPLPFALAWRRLEVLPEDADAFSRWLDVRLDEARRAAEDSTA
jgi:tetraacyldisaccharide 4'-kinase